jgi:hypothetical protein
MLDGLIRWLFRKDIRPAPEAKAEPPELAEMRQTHEQTKRRAYRALDELRRVERSAGGKRND